MKSQMEKTVETPVKEEEEIPIQILEEAVSEQKTPTSILPQTDQNILLQSSPNSGVDLRKSSTPDRLKVPKAFKYPERYRSPTDSMMSPVTKGLLARGRKGGALLPPSKNHHKIQDLCLQDVGPLQEIKN